MAVTSCAFIRGAELPECDAMKRGQKSVPSTVEKIVSTRRCPRGDTVRQCSPRRGSPSSTTADLLFGRKCRRVARRMSLIASSAGCFSGPDFCLIFAPCGYDDPEILPSRKPPAVSKALTADNRACYLERSLCKRPTRPRDEFAALPIHPPHRSRGRIGGSERDCRRASSEPGRTASGSRRLALAGGAVCWLIYSEESGGDGLTGPLKLPTRS